jgi:hypothetical protein
MPASLPFPFSQTRAPMTSKAPPAFYRLRNVVRISEDG